jgi:hypothetical protein
MSLDKRDQEIYAGLVKVTATQPRQKLDQQRFEISLTTARDYEEIQGLREADFMLVESLNGTAKVRLNEVNGPEYDLTVYHSFVKSSMMMIQRVFLYNAAQAGKILKLALGGDASFQATTNPTVAAITGAVSIADTSGSAINPTEMATIPTIYNKTCTVADTEYSQALPAGTKKFVCKFRNAAHAGRIAFVTGKVATPTEPYWSIWANGTYNEDQIKGAAITIYVASGTAGAVLEIVAWS